MVKRKNVASHATPGTSRFDDGRADDYGTGAATPGDYARDPAVAAGRKTRKGSRQQVIDDDDADAIARDRPEAYRRRHGTLDGRMIALNGSFAEFCRDLQMRQIRALYPDGVDGDEDDKKDDGGGVRRRGDALDALVARADPDELDRIGDITKLGTREYERQVSMLRGLYVPPSGEVAIFGNNDSIQLGVGEDHFGDVIRPRLLPNLKAARIIKVAAGGLHNVALADDGSVYTWGSNDRGSLGRDGSEYVPVVVDHFQAPSGGDGREEVILSVSAGDTQTLCVGLSGRVYQCGTYRDKEGKEFRDLVVGGAVDADTGDKEMLKAAVLGRHMKPVVVAGIEGAIDVKCGSGFNAALCKDGSVRTWGLNQSGELARGPVHEYLDESGGEKVYDYCSLIRHHLTPLPATFTGGLRRAIESVACGGYHLLAVTCPGQEGPGAPPGTRLYSAGLNQYGQLGLGDLETRFHLTRVELLDEVNVSAVAAGQHHSLAMDGCGHLVAFGRGDSGQLGITDKAPEVGYFQMLPVYVKIPTPTGVARDRATHIECGDVHSLAVTEGGALYTWGYGDSCALGHGRARDEFRPRRVDVAKGLGGAGKKKEEEAKRRYAEAARREEAGQEVEMGDAVVEEEEEEQKEPEKAGDDLSVKVVQASCGAQHTVILCSVTKKPKA